MKTLLATVILLTGLTLSIQAQDPALAGRWFGVIDTDRGQMDIGLIVSVENGKLVGVLKTAHGDWTVTEIAEKDGRWTVAFSGDGNKGQMTGRIEGDRFTGDWRSAMANGRFELERSKKR